MSRSGSERAVALNLAGAFAVLALLALSNSPARAQGSPHGDLDLDCSRCHTVEGWTPLRDPLEFEHQEVGRPLEQGHEGLDCLSCHQNLIFAFVPTACADCHEDPHRGELGYDCEVCHRPSSWDNRRTMSDFHSATLFPLTGIHATVDCAACHRREPPFEYSLTPTDCFSCHMADYQSTMDPDHVAVGFPTDCQFCHNTIDWNDADFDDVVGFDHSLLFQLTGAHATLDCGECHVDGFSGTPTECVGCHRADYNATSDPNHQRAGFDTRCENCHGTSTWEGAVLDHSSIFPLVGAHRALDCTDCHAAGFAGTPTDCYSCHRADYDATSDPDHRAAGFGTDCEDCHNETSWAGAVVNHDSFWPLTGSHRGLDCEECHADGFAGTPTDCVACHRGDYDRTRDPNHAAAGFPTNCEACHNTRSWGDANFNHSFPIYSGPHREGAAWDDCSDCHPNQNSFAVFDCTACHSRSEMNEEHDDVRGYVYESNQCLACHPTGREDDAEDD